MHLVTALLEKWNIEYCDSWSDHIFVIDDLKCCTVLFSLTHYSIKNFNEFLDDALKLDKCDSWEHISSNTRGLILDHNNIHWSFIFRDNDED